MIEPDLLLNRESSWLEFDRRVLSLALDPLIPALERVKFLAIASGNLDEFFQVRVASIKDRQLSRPAVRSPDGRSPAEQHGRIVAETTRLIAELDTTWCTHIVPALAEAGIHIVGYSDLDVEAAKHLDVWFERSVFPVLTPLSVDPGHPFPYISSLSLNLGVLVADQESGERRFARIKVPTTLPRIVSTGDGRFILLEDAIGSHLDLLFPGMEIVGWWCFRVTRHADPDMTDEVEADDLLEAVEQELALRRFGRAVRLEVEVGLPAEVLDLLLNELELAVDDVFEQSAPLQFVGMSALAALGPAELRDTPWPTVVPNRVARASETGRSMIDVVSDGDLLVHHPYESFGRTVEALLYDASVDPQVLSIKMALYRTSGDGRMIRSLARAAERGAQVVALVELKARFDEEANISWARTLEQAGVHVVYGFGGLKMHAKVLLIVRDEPEGLRRYAHLGTGNYNASTAQVYEDIGLLSTEPDLTRDISQLFNQLTGFSKVQRYEQLLVAPDRLRPRLVELIANEAELGDAGRIVIKANAVADPGIIESLYEASKAGTQIDLIVRGICTLRPGLTGVSDNIRVRSVIGRHLEHSRIYHFAHGTVGGSPLWMIGSADLLPRNLDRRVEALAPVSRPDHQARLAELIDSYLHPDAAAWTLTADGSWLRPTGSVDVQSQAHQAVDQRAKAPTMSPWPNPASSVRTDR